MTECEQSGDSKKVSCEVCKKEIPKSAAQTSEGLDMATYFCCPDCMEHWEKLNKENK